MRISGVTKPRFIEHENLGFIYHPLNPTEASGEYGSLLFSFLFLLEHSDTSCQTRNGGNRSQLGLEPRDFYFSRNLIDGRLFVLCDLSGFPLIFPIRNLEVRATWTTIRQPLLSPIHGGDNTVIWMVKDANWIADSSVAHR